MLLYTEQKKVTDLTVGDAIISNGFVLYLQHPIHAMLGERVWAYTRYDSTSAVGSEIHLRASGSVSVLVTDHRDFSPELDADTIAEMRAWVADCEWADETEHLSDRAIINGVARHYVGGVAQFLADAS